MSKAREAADSMKPGVERSGTPGTVEELFKARGAAVRGIITIGVFIRATFARFAGSEFFWVDDPGVALRFTPGFMLMAAPRTKTFNPIKPDHPLALTL